MSALDRAGKKYPSLFMLSSPIHIRQNFPGKMPLKNIIKILSLYPENDMEG
jgi:hypothetical protein